MARSLLAIAPHTDDVELGAGGTLARLSEDGWGVRYVALSEVGNPALPGEVGRSMACLDSAFASVTRFPNRYFPACRQSILEYLEYIRDKIQPSLVLVPALGDVHQDHQTVTEEALRVFKAHRLLGYEQVWNQVYHPFRPGCFIRLERSHVEKKIEMLRQYRSQAHREYTRPANVRALARVRGLQAGTEYAEAFEVLRWVV